MMYHISETLIFMPYLAGGIIIVSFFFLEVKQFRDAIADDPYNDDRRGGFTPPPGDGYEYYVSSNTIVYILRTGRHQFRAYLVEGDQPNAKIKKDKYGYYITMRCDCEGEAEKIIDDAYIRSIRKNPIGDI